MGAPAESLDESHDRQHMGVTERPGVTHVPTDAARPVRPHDRRQPASDIGHRLVPAHLLESGGGPAQRSGHAIGVVDDLGERNALLAGEPRGQWVLLVRAQRDEPAVLDGGDHAAQRLADPAERHF